MEIRKLQRTGGSSLTITLPKKWIDDTKLGDKDLVKIIQDGSHSLILQPANLKKQILRAVIKADALHDASLGREILAQYISGVDEIIIRSTKLVPERRNKIRSICSNLIGFELVDESSDEIVLKNIMDPLKFPMSENVGKMFLITRSMVTDAFKSLLEKDLVLARDLVNRDIEVDKLYLTITRQLYASLRNKVFQEELGLTEMDLFYYGNVATQIERIADHAVKIGKIFSSAAEEVIILDKKSVHEIEEKIIDLLDKSAKMVKTLDKHLAHAILDLDAQIEDTIYSKEQMGEGKTFAWNLINDSFDRFRGYIMNIAEVTIDHVVAV